MKLPKGLPARMHSAPMSYQEDYEAIVRDIIRVLRQRAGVSFEEVALRNAAKEIEDRYGLTDKPGSGRKEE